jgi:hypothetical protein
VRGASLARQDHVNASNDRGEVRLHLPGFDGLKIVVGPNLYDAQAALEEKLIGRTD